MGPFLLADGFAFDPTGSRVAFIVTSGNGYYAVIDGRPFGPTQELPFIEFSDDGERFIYGDQVKQLIYVIDPLSRRPVQICRFCIVRQVARSVGR
jgi:hypothetical protein